MASSHAVALDEPETWDKRRLFNRKFYEKKYGTLPVEQPRIAAETTREVNDRYAKIREAFRDLRNQLVADKPDALIIVGDDQDENFNDLNSPQFAIYVGDEFVAGPLSGPDRRISSHPALGEALLKGCVEADIDISCIRRFAEDRLFGHAFCPVLQMIDPDGLLPVIPIFLNAIHMPAPSPSRCYYLGETIRRIVESCTGVGGVAIYGSGGLSHFTAGYPWKHYSGKFAYGSIDSKFDYWLLEWMTLGDGAALVGLTTQDLLNHGEIELRSWIVTLGALGNVKPDVLAYEPFYSAIMGMGVASWPGTQ